MKATVTGMMPSATLPPRQSLANAPPRSLPALRRPAAPPRQAIQTHRPSRGSMAACRAATADLLKDAVRLDADGNEALRFLTPEEALEVRRQFGTPAYVYDMATLKEQARSCLAFPNPFGLTARFAMKASPNAAILKLFLSMGLHVDASSGYEVQRAMAAGFKPEQISLSSQELPSFFEELISQVRSQLSDV